MIDVMFFLLATFMLTSLAMQRIDAVRINLPQGQAQQMSADRPPTLSVNRANQIFINQQAVTLSQISGSVARLLGPDANIVVAADDRCIARRRRAGDAGSAQGRRQAFSCCRTS